MHAGEHAVGGSCQLMYFLETMDAICPISPVPAAAPPAVVVAGTAQQIFNSLVDEYGDLSFGKFSNWFTAYNTPLIRKVKELTKALTLANEHLARERKAHEVTRKRLKQLETAEKASMLTHIENDKEEKNSKTKSNKSRGGTSDSIDNKNSRNKRKASQEKEGEDDDDDSDCNDDDGVDTDDGVVIVTAGGAIVKKAKTAVSDSRCSVRGGDTAPSHAEVFSASIPVDNSDSTEAVAGRSPAPLVAGSSSSSSSSFFQKKPRQRSCLVGTSGKRFWTPEEVRNCCYEWQRL